jgi:hypothetical protein
MHPIESDDIQLLAAEIREEISTSSAREPVAGAIERVLRKRLVPLGHSLPIEGELRVGGRKEGA